jgi:hypothetical protein
LFVGRRGWEEAKDFKKGGKTTESKEKYKNNKLEMERVIVIPAKLAK